MGNLDRYFYIIPESYWIFNINRHFQLYCFKSYILILCSTLLKPFGGLLLSILSWALEISLWFSLYLTFPLKFQILCFWNDSASFPSPRYNTSSLNYYCHVFTILSYLNFPSLHSPFLARLPPSPSRFLFLEIHSYYVGLLGLELPI